MRSGKGHSNNGHPHYRCRVCGTGKWRAGGWATAEQHFAETHPGVVVDIEIGTFGSAGYYTPHPNAEDTRKGKR